VVVVGIGYVGLPLALEFARAGFRTVGLDVNVERVQRLNDGVSYIADVSSAELAAQVMRRTLRATTDPSVLADADAVVVCVPTPLNKTKDPDVRHVMAAVDQIAQHQHAGMLIVLESTTYPGMTQELLVPRFTQRGFELGKDVFVAYSPERVDPGNTTFKTHNTPKVIGGATPACLEVACALYAHVVTEIVPVSSTEAAEMVKLLENTFRAVNIGLVNEVAVISRRLGIDPFEVIQAASTKPFGFMPFYPGPGLGGHCIPVDPLYLSWKLRTLKYRARFIELADSINSSMPAYVVERAIEVLNTQSKAIRGSNVLLYGVAYKRDVSDVRESPAIPIMERLIELGAHVAYMDPFVHDASNAELQFERVAVDESFESYDIVLITTDHSALDKVRLMKEAKLILDTRNALHGAKAHAEKLHSL
jgi:UDP-N-acetyl-D-glucosamine dehydrogenase